MSIFDTQQNVPNYRRNLFNLSRENIFTCEFGQIIPIMSEELLPGDSFCLTPSEIVKSAPMLAPIYGQINVDIHVFVVPLRLLWDKFHRWIYDPTMTSNTPPHVNKASLITNSRPNNLLHYLGVPSVKTLTSNKELNIFKSLAYLQIWKEYFRDEDLQTYPSWLDDNTIEDYNLIFNSSDISHFTDFKKRAWRKDYFTSARPWPQKGTPPVLSLFQNQQIPVYFNVDLDSAPDPSDPNYSFYYTATAQHSQGFAAEVTNQAPSLGASDGSIRWFWDSSLAAGVSVSDLRSLFAVQKFLEMSAVVGSRYIEGNLAFFGTKIKDYRAQIPEFLGMTSQILHIDEVVQNSETDKTVQGHRTGQGSTAFQGRKFKYFASEKSLVFVLQSIRPKAVYFQGLQNFWKRIDQFDFPTPIFQSIGEQEVAFDELVVGNGWTDAEMDKTFGYQSRYADVRSARDEVHGDFVTDLDHWHLGRILDPQTVLLNEDFITISPSEVDGTGTEIGLNRIFAYTEEDSHHFWVDSFIEFIVKRKLHYHTTPALIG